MRSIVALIFAMCAVTVAQAEKYKVGQAFPDFEAVNVISEEKFKLSDYRGKVVLIDFWATWCGPCLRELPNIHAIYDKHYDKGFEIIGVSLDRSAEKCMEFMRHDGMKWPVVCDGRYWNAALARRFDVRHLPTTFLIGRDGVLIAADVRGDELASAVEQALSPSGAADLIALATATSQPATSAPATATPAEAAQASAEKQAEDWLTIARGMAANRNYALARRYYTRLIETFPEAPVAKTAKEELEKLPKD